MSILKMLWINKYAEKFFGLKIKDVLDKYKKKHASEYTSILFENERVPT